MRLDKYLKVTRIIKRRTIANEACSQGRVEINDKTAKPGSEVKIGDIISIRFGDQTRRYQVMGISDHVPKGDASSLIRELD